MIRKIIVSLLVLLLLTGCKKSEVLPYTINDKELVSKPFEIQSLLAYENDDTYLINIKIKSVPNMTGALFLNSNEPIFFNESTTGEDVFSIEFQKQYLEKCDELTIAFWTTGNDHVDINISKEQFLNILESSKSIPRESNVINNEAERINTEPYKLTGSLFETKQMQLNKLSLYQYNDNYVLGVSVKTKEGFDVCFFDVPNGDNTKKFAGPTTGEVEDYYIEIPKNVYDEHIEFGVNFFCGGEEDQGFISVYLDKFEIEGNFDGEFSEVSEEYEGKGEARIFDVDTSDLQTQPFVVNEFSVNKDDDNYIFDIDIETGGFLRVIAGDAPECQNYKNSLGSTKGEDHKHFEVPIDVMNNIDELDINFINTDGDGATIIVFRESIEQLFQ